MKAITRILAGGIILAAYFTAAQSALLTVSNSSAPGSAASNAPAAAAVIPTPPRPNAAIIPQLNRGFLRQHTNNVEVARKGDIDLLFMGDSITDWWRNPGRGANTNGVIPMGGKAVFEKYFGAMKVANFGIAGDTTQGVLFRLRDGEGEGYKPKAIMLMIGTNNTGGNSPPEIAMGVADVVFELRKDFPDAKILLLAIFPRDRASSSVRSKIT